MSARARCASALGASLLLALAAPAVAQPESAPAARPVPGPRETPPPIGLVPADEAEAAEDEPRQADRLEIDDCGARPELTAERLRKLAGEHYDRGDVLYVQGDYVGAVSELVSSYCLLPHYRVLKDIGQAYERQLEYSRAIAYLKRYVAAVPDDAKAAACAPDPQQDKRNVSARIEVLSSLPARIRIATEPPGAEVTLTGDDGLIARGVAGEGGGLLLARAGRYEMVVSQPGFVARRQRILAEIGKPYSYVFQLERERGHLDVQAVPGNARLFLNDRFVGTGRYQADLSSDTYTLTVEAPERISERRRIEVRPKQTEHVVVELPPRPQNGRTQLLVYSGFAGGAVLAGSLANTNSDVAFIAGVTGLAVGGIGGYLGIPDDLRLGTSSLTITGSLGAGLFSTLVTSAVTDDAAYLGPIGALGTVAGGAAGYAVGELARLGPGDAALINSGLVWGTVYGALFATAFDNPEDIDVSLAAGGMGLGLLTSSLLMRQFSVSRAHAALIDLGGVGGLVVSASVRSLIDQRSGDGTASAERQAHFALGGLTLGLAAAALLTRNYDSAAAPRLAPSVGRLSALDGASVASYGVTGQF